jgi:ADP-dependent phosphofructokinase/glucokinase
MATQKKKTTGECKSCKKKALITELPSVIEIEEIYVPTVEEIKLAYVELGNKNIEPHKEQINKVYSFLFNEEFDFGCRSCVNTQARKLREYIKRELGTLIS